MAKHVRGGEVWHDQTVIDQLVGKVVYLAGPYTLGNNNHNTRRACDLGDVLIDLGIYPLIPHMSHLWDSISPREYPPEFWYHYDLQLLKKCDAMVVMPGSEESRGVALERDFANEHSIPVYDWSELKCASR
jgi:nucleoside 2-deoxyribosyltransferase